MPYNDGTVPTLAQEITGDFVAPVYSKKVIMHTMSSLVIANAVRTDLREDLKFGNIVYLPLINEVTTAEVTPGTEATAINAVGTPVSLTVDKWRVAAIEESEMMNIEDHVGYLDEAAKSCAYAIAKDIDTTLGARFSSLGGYSTSAYGSDGQTFTDDIFIYLMETLDESDVPRENRALISDPSCEADLRKIDKFVTTDYVRTPVVPTGQFGSLYGVRVLITNNLTAATTGNYGCLLHRDALGLVLQKEPYVQRIPMPWVHKTKYQVKVIYGTGELRDTFGVPFFTRKS